MKTLITLGTSVVVAIISVLNSFSVSIENTPSTIPVSRITPEYSNQQSAVDYRKESRPNHLVVKYTLIAYNSAGNKLITPMHIDTLHAPHHRFRVHWERLTNLPPDTPYVFRIPAKELFGPRKSSLVVKIPRPNSIPGSEKPGTTHLLPLEDLTGRITWYPIVQQSGDSVKIDMNHPLAGYDLEYTIEVLDAF